MRRVPSPRALLWAAIAAWTAGFAGLSILRQDAFNTGRFDMGNMVQAVWSSAHGDPLQVTSLAGEQTSRLASHFDPILIVFAPLWWIWPSPDMLVTVQAAAVALGAVPVFWLAHKHLGPERAGLGFALAYLLYPATQWLALNEFHPVALACPLLLFAFWYLDEDRLIPFALLALAASTAKEEIPLVVAGFGVWYAVTRRRWLTGAAVCIAGVLVSYVAVNVVVPHFNGSASNFYSRYSQVGSTPTGIVGMLFTHPARIWYRLTSDVDLQYLKELFLPLGGLWLLAPVALVAAVPEILLNLLSKTPAQASIHYHYTAGLIPPLVVASVLGGASLARRRPGVAPHVAAFALAVMLVANFKLGAIPLWSAIPEGEDYQATYTNVSRHDLIAARAVRLIPRGAIVTASNGFGAHLSDRRRILSLPKLSDATWAVADDTKPSYLDRVSPLPAATDLSNLRRNPAWRLVFEEDGILVFHRVAHSG